MYMERMCTFDFVPLVMIQRGSAGGQILRPVIGSGILCTIGQASPLFSGVSAKFVELLAQAAESNTYLPGDEIAAQGEIALICDTCLHSRKTFTFTSCWYIKGSFIAPSPILPSA